ncbi:calcium-binding protein [Rhizobium sp. FKL33]|uniref:calcium-binding protein n=1 Tax=Rhizobium sp. FKL33 TaxID=2562307 RepID=UPI0010C00C3F|nr:calcium-binding protein [Rhizobium sp. FKL33]
MIFNKGFVTRGDDAANKLSLKYVTHEDESIDAYNIIYAGGGNDILWGNIDREYNVSVALYGEDGNDIIWDGSTSDTLSGGLGDDTIHYDDGDDIIDGGEGYDVLDLHTKTSDDFTLDDLKLQGIEKLIISDRMTIGKTGLNSFDTLESKDTTLSIVYLTNQTTIENINLIGKKMEWSFIGSKYDDVLDFSTNTAKIAASGNSGDDIIKVGANNSAYGGGGNDQLFGGSGNNRLNGDGGNDTLIGGAGKDYLLGDKGDDRLEGGLGSDTLRGGSGNDLIIGGADDDKIYADGGVNTVMGGAGNDYISYGGSEGQLLKGGDGDDVVNLGRVGTSGVSVYGGEGTDRLVISSSDALNLSVEDVEILDLTKVSVLKVDSDLLESFDKIRAGDFAKTIYLSSQADLTWEKGFSKPDDWKIFGSDASDKINMAVAGGSGWTVNGGAGDDLIIGSSKSTGGTYLRGGDGNDTLIGGVKDDIFDGGAGNDTIKSNGGTDQIKLKSGGSDLIVLEKGFDQLFVYNLSTQGKEQDKIDLSNFSAVKDFADLTKNHAVEWFYDAALTKLESTEIDLGNGSELILKGIAIEDLRESQFLF